MMVTDLKIGDLIETHEGFHIIYAIEDVDTGEDYLKRRFKVYSLRESERNKSDKRNSYTWNHSMPLWNKDWDMVGGRVLRFYRNGERLT